MSTNKKSSVKRTQYTLQIEGNDWTIVRGRLVPPPGRPSKVKSLFKAVAEKIPYEYLGDVQADLHTISRLQSQASGVYIAHDSMGHPRYIGRGNIFQRLRARKREQPHEIVYFSFYIVEDKKHEREIETIMIRAAGPLLHFNDRKKRVDINPGSPGDFEDGTFYYVRKPSRGG